MVYRTFNVDRDPLICPTQFDPATQIICHILVLKVLKLLYYIHVVIPYCTCSRTCHYRKPYRQVTIPYNTRRLVGTCIVN